MPYCSMKSHCLTTVIGLIFVIVTRRSSLASSGKIGCKDRNGNPVDWFMAYKLPELKENPSKLINEGYGFMYLDSNVPSKWVLSNVTLESVGQPIGYTLRQYYDRQNDGKSFYLLYNDEHPSGKVTEYYRHTKGNMLFDGETGYWMIHSAPKFPQNGSYAWAQNARRYGQSFFCISLPFSELNRIGKQLTYTMPFTYDYQLPPSMADVNYNMKNVIDKKWVTAAPWTNLMAITSFAGQRMVHFAKHRKWDKDLYYEFVAPKLKTSLYTETWMNGRGNLTSWCNGAYHVNNVFDISLPDGITFSDHEDHSKWAVSNGQQTWICNGDINRQHGQLSRGGGTMCMELAPVWNVYHQSVTRTQPCSLQP